MYLLFLLSHQGIPVYEIYSNTIKGISTDRFHDFLQSPSSEFKMEDLWFSFIKETEENHPRKEDEMPSEFPFDPEASYEDMEVKSAIYVPRPSNIPELNFEGLPVYETTDEDEPEEEEEGP